MSGPARRHSWQDARPENLLALKHGSRSPRVLAAKAGEVHAALVEAAPWISDLDADAVARYERAEARAVLLDDYVLTVASSDPAKLPPSLWDAATRADLAASTLAGALGLDPTSRARLLKDMGAARHYGAIAAEDAQRALKARYGAGTTADTSRNASGRIDAPNGHSDDSATIPDQETSHDSPPRRPVPHAASARQPQRRCALGSPR